MKKPIFSLENIRLSCPSVCCDEAILAAGRHMVEQGYVKEAYIDGMLRRNREFSVYIGNYLAMPHGVYTVKDEVITSGIVLHVYPNGIDWDGEPVKFVLGLAGQDNKHLQVIELCAELFSNMETVDKMLACTEPQELYNIFTESSSSPCLIV